MSSQAEAAITGADIAPNAPSDAELQAMLARAVRLFADRFAEHDGAPAAFPADAVTATQAMVAVTAILKAVNIQVFELGMWQAWGGR
jgi:hypothetical protein